MSGFASVECAEKGIIMAILKTVSASLIAIALSVPGLANAKTPPDVLKAYKAYNASMEKGDFKAAIKHAKTAWEKAESSLGSHVMTGDLAYNYGYVEKNQGDKSKAIAAFERSVELASLHSSDAAPLQLEREVELVSSMDGVSKDKKLAKRINGAVKFAEANGLGSSVFVGELYVHESNICSRRLNFRVRNSQRQTGSLINKAANEEGIQEANKKCAKTAKKAAEIFDRNVSDARPLYIAIANNYIGRSHEASKNYLGAVLSYQKARLAIEDVYGRETPFVAETIGRWMNARNYLKRRKQLEHAESQGLCKCWPFANDRPHVAITKWAEADFPAKALTASSSATSGYALVQMDVSDEGLPVNVRILNSWPKKVYDKSSLKAAKKLEFAPKTGDEPEGYRKDVTIPYNYYISQGLEPI